MTEPKRKIVCVRGFDADLYEKVKAQAKADGMLVREWIERALIHELVRASKQSLPPGSESRPRGEHAAKG